MPIRISIDYFNEEEKDKLKANLPTDIFQKINNYVSLGYIDIDLDEFKTHLTFTEQNINDSRFNKKEVLAKKVSNRYENFTDYFELDTISQNSNLSNLIINPKMVNSEIIDIPKDNIERMGVSIGLCIVNDFHNLSEADWIKIPISNKSKSLDFNFEPIISSTGTHILQLECKGHLTKELNSNARISQISKSRQHVLKKKNDANIQYNSDDIVTPVVYYGTISVSNFHSTHVWLVDPISTIKMNPEKLQLLNRLWFYYDNLRIFMSRTQLVIALANRIAVIEKIENYQQLDNFPLYDSNLFVIDIENKTFSNYSKSIEGDIIGFISEVNNNEIVFIGYTKLIFEIIIEQNFNKIISYKEDYKVDFFLLHDIECLINKKDLEKYNFPETLNNEILKFNKKKKKKNIIEKKEEKDDDIKSKIKFFLRNNNNLIFSKSGRVWGIFKHEDVYV